MKYKVIKKFPKGLDAGEILFFHADSWYKNKHGIIYYTKKEVESNPEFFTPYLLTTADGVEIYKGDSYWYIWQTTPCRKESTMTPYRCKYATLDRGESFSPDVLFFSTKEAAEKWLAKKSIPEYVECVGALIEKHFTVGKVYNWPNPVDNEGDKRDFSILDGPIYQFKPSTKEAYEAQQKPSWKKGEWLMVKDNSMFGDVYKMLFRFDHFEGEANGYVYGYELYTIWDDGRVKIEPDVACMCHKTEAVPATSKKIESVLSKVAEYKGFKPGAKVTPFEGLVDTDITGEWTYIYWSDALYAASPGGRGLQTYHKGKWATIIEEPNPVQQPEQFPIRVKWGTNSVVESEERNCIVDFDVDGKVMGFEIL